MTCPLNDVTCNRRGAAEEFDLVVINASPDPLLSREGSYFLVECKNWSQPIDPTQLIVLRDKLRRRFGRARLGLLIGMGGFTAGVRGHLASANDGDQLVVLLDRSDLAAWIDAPDRAAWLRQRVQTASLRG